MIFNNNIKYSTLFARNFAVLICMSIVTIVVMSALLVPTYIKSVAEQHSSKVIEYLEKDVEFPLLVGNEEALGEYTDTLGELPWISSVSFATAGFENKYTVGKTDLANEASLYGEGVKHWSGAKQLHSTKIIEIGDGGGKKMVGGYVHIGIDKKHVNYAVFGMMLVLSAAILLSFIVMIPGYRRTSKKVVQPIVELSSQIKNTRRGDSGYQKITMSDVPREISDVVAVVNEFVDTANEHNSHLEEEVRRRTEELEATVEKLKVSESFRSSMMMNSSHDLRSPLTSLIGFIDMAREFNESKNHEKVSEALEISHTASLEIEEQIETFLVYMGDESSEIIREDKVSIDAVVHRVLHQLNATAIQSGNKTSYEHIGPHSLVVDKPKLERVLHGLISNAYNYCSDGRVKIRTHADESLRITVEDSGVGMDSDRLETIFIKDYSGGESHSGHRGVGIGLAMCKGWVDMMGGDINVESVKGKMTKFIVNIPVEINATAH